MVAFLNLVGAVIFITSAYSGLYVMNVTQGVASGSAFGDAFMAWVLQGGLGTAIDRVLVAIGFFTAAAFLSRLGRLVAVAEGGRTARWWTLRGAVQGPDGLPNPRGKIH